MNSIRFIKLVFILLALIAMLSCEKIFEVEEPVACFSIINSEHQNATTAKIDEELVFAPCDFLNDADFYVIWTGDEGHSYQHYIDSINSPSAIEEYTEKDRGRILDSEAGYPYSYSEAGKYTITWIATNNNGFGDNTKHAILKREIEILAP